MFIENSVLVESAMMPTQSCMLSSTFVFQRNVGCGPHLVHQGGLLGVRNLGVDRCRSELVRGY